MRICRQPAAVQGGSGGCLARPGCRLSIPTSDPASCAHSHGCGQKTRPWQALRWPDDFRDLSKVQSLYREHALSNRSLLHPSQSPSIAFVRLRTRSPERLARGPVKDGVFGHFRSFRHPRARPPEPGNSFGRAQSRSYALSAGAASSFGVCRLRCRTRARSAGSPAQGTAAHRQRPVR